jgi:hypothetical protein
MAVQRERRGLAVIRRCRRFAALVLAAAAGGLAALPAMLPADAAITGQDGRAARAAEQRTHPWIAITKVSPGFLRQGQKVTVTGIVTNPGGAPLRDMSVQIWSSQTALTSRAAMASYLTSAAATGLDEAIIGATANLPSPVPAHGTEQWSMTLTADQIGMTVFGVYPLSAHLTSAGIDLDYARSFLPYWPGKPQARAVKPVSIAWVWPLIDTPQQTICRSLASNELAGSLATGGRLNSLLAAGESPAGQAAMLTWAIDPALLSDAAVMTRPYRVSSSCSDAKLEQASSAARSWLAGVHDIAQKQDFFTTPYANVDVAAMAHQGLDDEIAAAFADGKLAAEQTRDPATQTRILGEAQRITPPDTGLIAWPTGGIADPSALQQLTASDVKTVILGSDLIRSSATVTSLPNLQGGEFNALLADSTLTRILSGRRDQIPGIFPAGYATPSRAHPQARTAAAFGNEQWFLAETAMIAAQGGPGDHAIIVAPPSYWNPLPGLAGALLAETGTAPWLRPATLGGLVSARTSQANAPLPSGKRVVNAELDRTLLHQVAHLYQQVQLLDNILTTNGKGYLSTAVDTVASSAWRGRRSDQRPALRMVRHDLGYVSGQLQQVKIVGSSRVTLGGQNGVVPVSISNGLGRAVTVRLAATPAPGDQLTIGNFNHVVTVQAHTQRTIKISVAAAQAGLSTLTMSLFTRQGQQLPLSSAHLVVAATHFGTLAIVIITIALVVFLVSATARAIRRGGPADGANPEAEELDPMPSPPDPASGGEEPDSVVPRGADERQPAKEADEHATPGRADRS